MLDTIRVKWPIPPTQKQLDFWICKSTKSQSGESSFSIYNPVIRDTTLRFTYRPLGYDNKPLLMLELSLPKFLYGRNHVMITSIEETIDLINKYLADVPHIPNLDIGDGVLIRLDMCYNHQVGELVDDYVRALGNLDFPHRRTNHHRNEGVVFHSKHKKTKFYNKELESGFVEAKGILRQETTLLNGKDIQKLLKVRQPTLKDISFNQIAEFLKDDLAKLGLLNYSIATCNTALKQLCEAHGTDAGIYYYALLVLKINKSKKEIANDIQMHPRSLDRKLKKIVDAGIPLSLTDKNISLSALDIILI